MAPHHLAVAVFFFMQGLCAGSWAARIPALQLQLGVGDAALGAILLAAPLGSLLSMPLAGWAVTRWGSAAVLARSALLHALGMVAMGWTRTPLQLAATLVGYGVANTLVQIAVNTQAVAVEARLQRSCMGRLHGLWSVGGFVGAALAAALGRMGAQPWAHFALVAASMLLLWGRFVGALIADAPAWPARRAPGAPLGPRRPDATLIGLGLLALAAMFCETTLFDWSAIYLHRAAGLSRQSAAWAYAGIIGAMAATRLAADDLVARLGRGRVLQHGANTVVGGLAVAVAAPGPWLPVAGLVATGTGLAALVPLLMGAAGQTRGPRAGAALAWISTIGFAGALAAPPAIGALTEQLGMRPAMALALLLAGAFRLGLLALGEGHLGDASATAHSAGGTRGARDVHARSERLEAPAARRGV